MIKIIHIARPLGGIGVYIDLLSKNIDNNTFSNSIICNTKEKGIDIKNANEKSITKFHVNLIREISPINDIKCFFKIINILQKEKPTIVHCHSAKAGVLGRFAAIVLKIPVVYTPHAYSFLSTKSKLKKQLFKGVESLFRFFNVNTIACSASEYHRAIYDVGLKKEKVYVWNNSIEYPIKAKNNSNFILPNEFICSIGRPSYQKNTELLIKSIAKIRQKISTVHLVILGVGLYSPLIKDIEALIKKYALEKNITLVPWCDRLETMDILKKCQIYTSTSRYEGLPYSVIEALALSKPCVVTNVDGNKDLVKNNFNGFLVSENEGEIAKKIIQLLKDKTTRTLFAQNAHEDFLKNYSIQNTIHKLENIYKTILIP
ncbi:glycosyltransferase [Tenacibaculum maritimum]|uniref:glycosyltransferase n=1 Tax=Tenacibaculum maritimum TaxID=107401 RepID=UPI0012E609F3|nr:glycosyltransferase [Tenacibaculum maritimum]CAA0167982.1 Glycosyltransferase, family GT4 [Tenacibaculum maritimum]CAA0184871.1 Glycosyltransferase, family GT4 [Tenacibaculum maritimum]